MWENITIAVCLLGFIGALALMLVELPTVVAQMQHAVGSRRRVSRDARRAVSGDAHPQRLSKRESLR
jgi:hypothetical protein